jgi:hypothetical protein
MSAFRPAARMAFLYMLLVVFESRAVAQANASSAFSLGATVDDTYKVFGPPSQWYASTSPG